MSFCVSHRTALDKNIRHIYSGLPTDVRFRNYGNSANAAIDIHDRIWERHKRPPKLFETKYQEYNPDYKTRMPRAPAFRQANAEEVQQITSRLTRPTLMTVLRQQPAVTGRSSSRSPGPTSGRSTAQRSDSETPDARHRKISYKEWSDDGSDVYYIDDSYLEDSSRASPKKEGDSEDGVNDYNSCEGRESFKSHSQQQQQQQREDEKPIQDVNTQQSENRRSSYQSDDNTESGNDMKKTKYDTADKKSEISSNSPLPSQSEKNTTEAPQRKGQKTKQKLNILQEIIQTRNEASQRNLRAKKASSPSPVKEGRKLENRDRINNRIGRSPYSEPVPRLGNSSIRYQQRGISCKKTQPRTPSPGAKMSDSSHPRTAQDFSTRRPQSQVRISRPRQYPLTSQYRPESRGTAVYLRPTRSKSAPGYKVHDDRRGIPQKRKIHPNRNDNNSKNTKTVPDSKTPSRQSNHSNGVHTRSDDELDESTGNDDSVVQSRSSRARHQSSKSARTTEISRETSWSLAPSSAQPRSQSVMASRQIEMSKRLSPRNSHDIKYTSCCMPAVENDLLVRFGLQPKGERSFYVSNTNRRYASTADMEAASRRLMTPTAAQLIRDRMRWAPNNDIDLEDPVRVIRETVSRRSRMRKSRHCNGAAWESFDMDSDGQREEEEGTNSNVHGGYRRTDKEVRGRGKHPSPKEDRGKDKTRAGVKKTVDATIDFEDSQGNAATTKRREQEIECRSTATNGRTKERSRSRSTSQSPKPGSISRSRSRSMSKSRSSNSDSRSRSRSRSRSTSRSSSRSRSRSTHRSRSSTRSSRSRSNDKSSSPFVSGGYSQTELESSEDVQPKEDFETNAETTSSGEERGGASWEARGPGQESSGINMKSETERRSSNHGVVQDISLPRDSSANDDNLPSGSFSDDPRASSRPSSREQTSPMKSLASVSSTSSQVVEDRSHWKEDSERTEPETRSEHSNANESQDRGDEERSGDDFFSRGRENENRGLERGQYVQIDVRDSENGPTRNSLHSPTADGPRISYSVQKDYAQDTEGGSSYYSTDYNADVTDAEESAPKSTYHRVTFHDDN